MEYIVEHEVEKHYILCCECGTEIEPNPTNMCVACLRTHVDITEGIPKQATLFFCRACERYQKPPSMWIAASLESRELLSLCLNRIKGLKAIRLVDAGFIWTEPHSKRIKVKLTIEKEVINGAILQQTFVVEFVVHNQMCDDCHRVEAKDFWRACVQIRQKTSHKKTLFYLEQQILKHKAHVNTTSIKQVHDGLDFYYGHKQEARKLVDFLLAVVPGRDNIFLISVPATLNAQSPYDLRTTSFACHQSLPQQLGNLGQICVVYRVTQAVHLIDPNTCQIADVNGQVYWRSPFLSLCSPHQLTEYMVMEVDIIQEQDQRHISGHGQRSVKHVLADVWVIKVSELGSTEQQYHCRTHLGHLLNCGDIVLGFDMRTANVNDKYLEKIRPDYLPDVILVRKVYGDSQRRQKKRKWKLRHLNGIDTLETENHDRDYNEFLEDLEEDPEYRKNIDIYKNADKIAVESDDTDDDLPRISLAEMLDDLHISGDATGGEGAEMVE
ncbi:hypothetical protein LSH36_139g02023 [Paralvinella palmiformis]|uniref:60S ribosomal export protein NMD3 n=1 Tax=Paralvinella palmiformis TaxID=53620 RepID=A0AAD9JX67_9ANNE|nr:hypothetical protein LSH36_139g02023 [Paralvinella palmiformis]